LVDYKPFCLKPYRYPRTQKEEIERQIKTRLGTGFMLWRKIKTMTVSIKDEFEKDNPALKFNPKCNRSRSKYLEDYITN